MKIPLIKPYLPQSAYSAVEDVLKSGYLTEGPVTRKFEELVQSYVGSKYALAVSNCTVGLEIALRSLGIGVGDEVIVPDYTYPATASVISIVGAKPIFVDIDRNSLLVDYNEIEKAVTPSTKAVIPVSQFGNPLDYNRLNQIREKNGIFIIEDAACSLGSEFNGQKVGTFADISVFSCHPRKFITTGEGGIVTTDNEKLADWMNSYKHFGMDMSSTKRNTVSFELAGTNYKLSNILAAIGIEQMKIIDKLLDKRRELAENYTKMLQNQPAISLPKVEPEGNPNFQTYTVLIENRDKIMCMMRKEGIEVQIGTYSLNMHKAFKTEQKFQNSQWAYEHVLALPLYHEMTEKEQKFVVEKLINFICSCRR